MGPHDMPSAGAVPAVVTALPSSFRDPSGFVFRVDGRLYRQVNRSYREHFDQLTGSGLYAALVREHLLLPHEDVPPPYAAPEEAYRFLAPREVPFLSYPFEWSFGQLKDAALVTLAAHARALDHGMVLKDASAYNIQFVDGRPVFIDTLSFERYREGEPWIAYGQFCKHFLAPLALMARTDVRLSQLLRCYIDGVPLDLAARLLPWATRLRPSLGLHIHLHARAQGQYADRPQEAKTKVRPVSLTTMRGLVDSLQSAVSGLGWKPGGSEWFDYYEANNNYTDESLTEKERLVAAMLPDAARSVWDLGGNTGRFSRVAAARGANVVCWDIDPGCVEANYQFVRKNAETRVLPLFLDLTNPTPGLGWAHVERDSLAARGPVDVVMALGLVHHLAISNNVPLPGVLAFLARLGRRLLIEFVPKEDSQVRKLLATREDIFPSYTSRGFEEALAAHFTVERREPIAGTVRTLYLARRNAP